MIAPWIWLRSAAVILVLVAQGPFFMALLDAARANPYAGHVMLVPLLAAAMLWLDRRNLAPPTTDRHQTLIGASLVGFALVVGAVAQHRQSLTAQVIAFVMALAGLGVWCFGLRALRRAGFVLAFLLLMIPPPPAAMAVIVPQIQQLLAGFSAAVLECLQIPVQLDGIVLRLPGLSLVVAEQCTGLRFLFILVVLVSGFARFVLPRVSTQLILISLSVPVAILANAIRVTVTGAGAYLVGPEVATGPLHYYIGKGLWACALAVMVGIAVHLRARTRLRPDAVAATA